MAYRDPSDGSVRAHQPKPLETNAEKSAAALLNTTTSGLQTGSQKPENIARLEKSREWLKNYFHRRNENDRGSNGQQSTDGEARAPAENERHPGPEREVQGGDR